jgi:hypothetical protein
MRALAGDDRDVDVDQAFFAGHGGACVDPRARERRSTRLAYFGDHVEEIWLASGHDLEGGGQRARQIGY